MCRPCSLCIVPATPPARSHSSIFSFHAKAPVQLLCTGPFCLCSIFSGPAKKGPGLPPLPCRAQKPFLLPARGRGKVRPPARPGACVSPGRAYHRQASQEALNALSPASLAPPPVNGILSIACSIFLILNTIPLCPELAAKAFYSPRYSRGAFR